jgi:hypothetical protein
MSKWLSVILVVIVIAAAIGCGKKEAQKPTPTPTATPTATASAEPTGETGTLSNLEGDIQVLRSGASNWIAATSGMRVGTGDGLKTGEDGYVLITFFDGSVMEVEAGSEISVEELSKTSGGSTTVHINQIIGNTINRVENLVDSSSNYEVETPAGSAVVRGTIYNVNVEQLGYVAHTCIATANQFDEKQHSVVFNNNGKMVNIPESMTACCWEGGVPSDPFYSDPADDPIQTYDDGGGGGVPIVCNWNGTWYTDFGNMVLNQSGDQVMGIYFYFDGVDMYGGLIIGNVSGNMLTGWWVEELVVEGEGNEEYRLGEFEFTHWHDCNSFTGRWRECELPEESSEPVCDGEWDEWSGERCPLCRNCPGSGSGVDAVLNISDYQYPLQYYTDLFDIGGCRWYRVYLEETVNYYFEMYGGEFDIYGSYDDGDPVMEMYSYDCKFLAAGSEFGEGGAQLSFECPETGNYLLKVHEEGDDALLFYILAY